MSDDEPTPSQLEAAQLLDSAGQASNAMVSSGNRNRKFLVAYVALGCAAVSLEHTLSMNGSLIILAMALPVMAVQYFSMRGRFNPRPLLTSSAAYGWYAFLAVLTMTCLRAWIAEDPWAIAAKMFVSFLLLWHLLSSAQSAWDEDRVNDSQEGVL